MPLLILQKVYIKLLNTILIPLFFLAGLSGVWHSRDLGALTLRPCTGQGPGTLVPLLPWTLVARVGIAFPCYQDQSKCHPDYQRFERMLGEGVLMRGLSM